MVDRSKIDSTSCDSSTSESIRFAHMEQETRTGPVVSIIDRLFAEHGQLVYGERVNQLEHALQCASLAQRAGSTDELITAALLHDIGHMLHRDAAGALAAGENDRHETIGAKFLARWFNPAVSEPVSLHVQAKRYLCNREPSYWDQLSLISKRTLELQGGPMNAAEATAFEALPHAEDAVRVRRWDDGGKCSGASTESFDYFMSIVARCVRR